MDKICAWLIIAAVILILVAIVSYRIRGDHRWVSAVAVLAGAFGVVSAIIAGVLCL